MCPAVAYEMLVSHSPPVFSHSPPTGFLSDYSPFRLGSETFPRSTRGTCRNTTVPTSLTWPNKICKQMPASPRRPCLVIRPEETPSSVDDPVSPTKLKKRVVFADDKGMSLTHVRVMTEPSNVPPLWSLRFLAEVTQGITAEPEAQLEPWEIMFPQPASDYVDFRKRLEMEKVSLENVIVKDTEDTIVGTVKVSNLSYHKEVIVRVSYDSWKTFEDAFCNFVPTAASASATAAYVIYDTFSFKIPIRPRAKKIEFCVCFRCDGCEYWDSNNGKNYLIIKKNTANPMQKSFSADDVYRKTSAPTQIPHLPKCVDAVQAKLDSWSEFASWTHLENSSPYW